MATCAALANNVRAPLALVLLAAALAAGPLRAEPEMPALPKASPPAQDVLEQLRAARAGHTGQGAPLGSLTLPVPSAAQGRRAFEALRKRAPAPELEARARAAQQSARKALAAERETMARRIGAALGLDGQNIKAIGAVAEPPLAKAWVPVLFVSSSMPVATLRSYAAQLERAGGVLAFRGMPGGLTKVAPMAKLSAAILRLDPGCEGPACAMRGVQIIVDPLLFRQHAISRVPALTLVPGDPAQPYCEREEGSPRGTHLVLGDAALSGLFEEYARLGGKEEVRDAAARLENR